ncbi:MAG: hypothetical protein M1818_006034 [Claussenomyces sp. TS43310]|nr:MAG: hypothetical protein M1818_006034 [Claussenomyces sp. TS43310]
MLFTKPLTTFLNANRTAQLQTLALITPSGKVLSSSSTSSAPVLRAQATLACSLWALYNPLAATGTLTSSLPPHTQGEEEEEEEEDEDDDDVENVNNRDHPADPEVSSVLIQLEHGTMVIRALRCSLLFIAIAPPSPASSIPPSSGLRPLHHDLAHRALATSLSSSPPSSHAGSSINGDARESRLAHEPIPRSHMLEAGSAEAAAQHHHHHSDRISCAASDAGSSSVGATGGGGASMRVLKRQAEDLAKWLEQELAGFTLATAL